ncbi:hypothetical protein FisN_1Lh243 [Fistulifera solaris]|uniref:HIT-type domain-containing protein n=1 Tax=Fistulifera solaris TaxID=1519565 RepID=A0A1Z5K4A8_FISSO|nr:hypothetical protein FisN_1Lh243 [Fistulifera solaris]|eukprot:GAX21084.1 hypothetical protein FisN_1Lh243 [Fistulifera solaris]
MEPTDLRHHFLIQKHAARNSSVLKTDLGPSFFENEVIGSDSSSSCQVCRTNRARYACPRCSLPYCSVTCFQEHNTGKASTCVEAFYQERVHQVLNLDIKAKKEQTQEIIQRVHEQQHNTLPPSGVAPCGIPEEQLYELLVALEHKDEGMIQQLLRSNRPLRLAVTRGLQHDNLHEWLLDPWIPWWMPQFVPEDQENGHDSDFMTGTSLDEYIVSLSPLSSLRTGPTVEIRYNVLEVIYATVWTLRLYYGPNNAQELAEQAVETLLAASSVLSQNMSYVSLEAVLTHCATTSTHAVTVNECNTTWTDLMNDLVHICMNQRFVLKCFLEAKSIIKQAVIQAKRQENDKRSNHSRTERKSTLRRISKKIDFYASWCKAPSRHMGALGDDIRAWAKQWLPDETSSPTPDVLCLKKKQSDTSQLNPADKIRFRDTDDGSLFVQEVVSAERAAKE